MLVQSEAALVLVQSEADLVLVVLLLRSGISAHAYSCTPRESNSPIWKHQSSEGVRNGCGNSKQQEMDVWGFIKDTARI